MKENPLVTVMIPTFNRPEFFRSALESVLNQTYHRIEIVVSDDSTDSRTEQLIQPYLRREPKLKYVHHVGFSGRENIRWILHYDNPEARYVTWLMDDDMLAPESIGKMVGYYLEYEQLALVTSYRQVIDAKGHVMPDTEYTKPAFPQTSYISGNEAGKLLLYNLTNYVGEFSTVLMRKDYLREVCLHKDFAGSSLPDVSMWLKMFRMGDLVYINEPLSYLRLHENQFGQSPMSRVLSMAGWYSLVQYAWQNRIYLETLPEARKAILRCINLFINVLSEFADRELLSQIEQRSSSCDENVPRDLWEMVHRMLKNLAGALGNGYDLPAEASYPGSLVLEQEDIDRLPWNNADSLEP